MTGAQLMRKLQTALRVSGVRDLCRNYCKGRCCCCCNRDTNKQSCKYTPEHPMCTVFLCEDLKRILGLYDKTFGRNSANAPGFIIGNLMTYKYKMDFYTFKRKVYDTFMKTDVDNEHERAVNYLCEKLIANKKTVAELKIYIVKYVKRNKRRYPVDYPNRYLVRDAMSSACKGYPDET